MNRQARKLQVKEERHNKLKAVADETRGKAGKLNQLAAAMLGKQTPEEMRQSVIEKHLKMQDRCASIERERMQEIQKWARAEQALPEIMRSGAGCDALQRLHEHYPVLVKLKRIEHTIIYLFKEVHRLYLSRTSTYLSNVCLWFDVISDMRSRKETAHTIDWEYLLPLLESEFLHMCRAALNQMIMDFRENGKITGDAYARIQRDYRRLSNGYRGTFGGFSALTLRDAAHRQCDLQLRELEQRDRMYIHIPFERALEQVMFGLSRDKYTDKLPGPRCLEHHESFHYIKEMVDRIAPPEDLPEALRSTAIDYTKLGFAGIELATDLCYTGYATTEAVKTALTRIHNYFDGLSAGMILMNRVLRHPGYSTRATSPNLEYAKRWCISLFFNKLNIIASGLDMMNDEDVWLYMCKYRNVWGEDVPLAEFSSQILLISLRSEAQYNSILGIFKKMKELKEMGEMRPHYIGFDRIGYFDTMTTYQLSVVADDFAESITTPASIRPEMSYAEYQQRNEIASITVNFYNARAADIRSTLGACVELAKIIAMCKNLPELMSAREAARLERKQRIDLKRRRREAATTDTDSDCDSAASSDRSSAHCSRSISPCC
jgi:hypothetical protein